MDVLVTGGLGFIGSHLVSELLQDPDSRVVVVDNVSSTALAPDQIVAEIAENTAGNLEVRLENCADFVPPDNLRFDMIFHLASIVGPAGVLHHAGRITQSIIGNIYRMIRLAQQHEARLVFVSTSEVYGGGKDGYCEEATPCVFRGAASARKEYAAAKMACEISIENLCRHDKLDAVIIRPFNVAGRRQQGRGGFVLPRFVGQALLGLPLTVFGDGSQVRAFTDARDAAGGIAIAAEIGRSGDVYNIGNDNNRKTIAEVADAVLKATDSQAGKAFVEPQAIFGEHYREAADKFSNSDRIKALGWVPRHSLQATVQDVVMWMRTFSAERTAHLAGLAASAVDQDSRDRGGANRLAPSVGAEARGDVSQSQRPATSILGIATSQH